MIWIYQRYPKLISLKLPNFPFSMPASFSFAICQEITKDADAIHESKFQSRAAEAATRPATRDSVPAACPKPCRELAPESLGPPKPPDAELLVDAAEEEVAEGPADVVEETLTRVGSWAPQGLAVRHWVTQAESPLAQLSAHWVLNSVHS